MSLRGSNEYTFFPFKMAKVLNIDLPLSLFHSGYYLTTTLANSVDPDEMLHKAAFHHGLHCLLR